MIGVIAQTVMRAKIISTNTFGDSITNTGTIRSMWSRCPIGITTSRLFTKASFSLGLPFPRDGQAS